MDVNIQELLAAFLSQDNQIRGQAERVYESLKQTPVELVQRLLDAVQSGADDSVRTMAIVLTRKVVDAELWSKASNEFKHGVKSALVHCLQNEKSRHVARKIADTFGEIAYHALEEDRWPEFFQILFSLSQSSETSHKEATFLILAKVAFCDALQNVGAQLIDVLQTGLRDNDSEVRVAAACAVCDVVTSYESGQARRPFEPLVVDLLQVVSALLSQGNHIQADEVLERMIEVVEECATFYRSNIVPVMQLMFQIISNEEMEESTLHLVFEFLTSLAESAPGMTRKISGFVDNLMPAAFKLMMSVDDDASWYESEEDETEVTSFDVGQECMDRISLALGGNAIIPVASSIFQNNIGSEDWKARHASIIMISQIGEGCAKKMRSILGDIVGAIIQHFRDPHPRVRWAAVNAIGQLSTDFSPDLQENHHEPIVTALLMAMSDDVVRVKAHAAAAAINFAETARKEILQPYLDSLLQKLIDLVRSGNKLIQEQAITAIASIADSAEDYFLKYYDAVVPFLKEMLVGLHAIKEQRTLRGKVMECLTLIGSAVGKEKFGNDAKEIMQLLLQTDAQIEPDDPQLSYMLQAWARICKCIGKEFQPFLPYVIEPLFKTAQMDCNPIVRDVDDEEEDDEGVQHFLLDDKRVGIRTSLLDEKATACTMIACYIQELKEGFLPYVAQCASIMKPLLNFFYSYEVRSGAAQCFPELLRAVEAGIQTGQCTQQHMVELFQMVLPSFAEAIGKEPDREVLYSLIDAFHECIDTAGQDSLTDEQLAAVRDLIVKLMKSWSHTVEEKVKKSHHEDVDDEERETIKEELEEEEEILEQIGTLVGVLFKTHGARFLPLFQPLMELFSELVDASRSDVQKRVAICVIDDIIEHAGESAKVLYPQFAAVLLRDCSSDNEELRQSAAYGVGLLAQHSGDFFQTIQPAAVEALRGVLLRPDAREEDSEYATDNAVSAMSRICEYQPQAVNASEVYAFLYDFMPLTGDEDESLELNAQIVRLALAQHPGVFGDGYSNIKGLIHLLVSIYHTKLCREETSKAIEQLVQHLKSAGVLTPEVFHAACGGVPDVQVEKFRALL